jgi:glycerol-3-phosphate acyltransferase PlsY
MGRVAEESPEFGFLNKINRWKKHMELIIAIVGYFLGSLLPAEWMFHLYKHTSASELGVKPGTFAVLKSIGILPGIFCLIFDLGKGFLPPWLAINFFHVDLNWLPLIALSPVLGHNWPFLRWNKGGWGLAATGGSLVGLGGWLSFVGLLGLPFGLIFKKKPGVAIAAVSFPAVLAMLILFHLPWQVLVSALSLMLLEVFRRLTGEKKPKEPTGN